MQDSAHGDVYCRIEGNETSDIKMGKTKKGVSKARSAAVKRDKPATEGRARKDLLVPTGQEDHLTQDDPIIGQAFACVSFVSPRDVMPSKEAFQLDNYLQDVFLPKVQGFVEAATASPASVTEFGRGLMRDAKDIHTDYSAWLGRNQSLLDEKYAAENPLQLTTAGFKVRGSFPDLDTAKTRAQQLQTDDPNIDVFVAQVGAWCPFHPAAESVGDIVYDETELNTIMKLKREAEEARGRVYTENVRKRVELAKQEGAQTTVEVIPELPEEESCGDADLPTKDTTDVLEDAVSEDAHRNADVVDPLGVPEDAEPPKPSDKTMEADSQQASDTHGDTALDNDSEWMSVDKA